VVGENVIGQSFKQVQGGLAVDAAHISARLRRPLDLFARCRLAASAGSIFAHLLEFGLGEAELC
jgi:hypothetical protein